MLGKPVRFGAEFRVREEADRQLKLCGYEVYRFGGAELADDDGTAAVSFFERLFKKHQVA